MYNYKKILNILNIDSIIKDFIDIIEIKVGLIKIELREEIAKLVAKTISIFFLMILIFLMVIFLSITVATFLNELIRSQFLGYAIIAGFYFLIILLFKVFKLENKIEKIIGKSFNNLINKKGEGADE